MHGIHACGLMDWIYCIKFSGIHGIHGIHACIHAWYTYMWSHELDILLIVSSSLEKCPSKQPFSFNLVVMVVTNMSYVCKSRIIIGNKCVKEKV